MVAVSNLVGEGGGEFAVARAALPPFISPPLKKGSCSSGMRPSTPSVGEGKCSFSAWGSNERYQC